MPAWICLTCGVQYPDTGQPPGGCAICLDERQYVGWDGQRWTTMPEIAGDHTVVVREEEEDLYGVGVEPAFAIGQRALLVCTRHGNVLWDCVSLLDDEARSRITEPRADQQWIQRPSPRVELFDDEAEPVPGLALARIGGHFDGAAVLHWPAGAQGRGALLTGDTITVAQDRDWVSFMWSYPNHIPLDEATVLDIARRAGRFAFDRVYGGWWGRVVVHDGAAAVRRSADRYVARLRGQRPGTGR